MRKIIFRGKRVDGNEWLYGDLNHINGGVYIFDRSPNAPLNSHDWFEVIPETVGQFTGLLDKKGKEIFEGDIVRWINPHSNKTYQHYLKWDKHFASFALFEKQTDEWAKESDFVKIQHSLEIIGNIHSNPELLK